MGFRHVAQLLMLLLVSAVPGSSAAVIEKYFHVVQRRLNPIGLGMRSSVVVNGQWPGPAIEARDGDDIIIHVINNQSLPITIHWHGLVQIGTQWYDGVPGVTQCPIVKGASYTHKFKITGQIGTFWWHSHVAQLRNTLHGPIIVRPAILQNPEPITVPIAGEHYILGGDWYQESPQQLTAAISSVPFQGYPVPKALHINGGTLYAGLKYFTVEQGKWYRFRIIDTSMWASFNLIITSHKMTLLEADGSYLQPRTVDKLDVYPGQTYSVLVLANQAPGNYWVSLGGRFDVERANLRGLAVLNYAGQTKTYPTTLPVHPTQAANPMFALRQESILASVSVDQGLARNVVNKLLVLELNLNTLPNGLQLYSTNNVTFSAPSMPYLLADYLGRKDVYSTTAMPEIPPPGLAAQKDGGVKFASYAFDIPYGNWVQIVIQNHVPPGGLHLWHMHGYHFYVVARGNGHFNVSNWQSYSYNTLTAPRRNTIALYEGQWSALRFQAVNPGQWIFHCHNEQHADQGMLVILKVRSPKGTTLSAPPPDYPSC